MIDIVTNYNQQIESVLYSNVEPEEKVYKIARILHREDKLHALLWYAVLELKEKHFLGNRLSPEDRIDE